MLQLIVGLIIGAGAVWVWLSKKQKEAQEEVEKLKKEIKTAEDDFGELSDYNKKVAGIKEQRKQKILSHIKEKGKTDAGKVSQLLDVSRYTAFRYLDELEKDGQIEQIGAMGRGVEYKAK